VVAGGGAEGGGATLAGDVVGDGVVGAGVVAVGVDAAVATGAGSMTGASTVVTSGGLAVWADVGSDRDPSEVESSRVSM
jgi:hypothetical protein